MLAIRATKKLFDLSHFHIKYSCSFAILPAAPFIITLVSYHEPGFFLCDSFLLSIIFLGFLYFVLLVHHIPLLFIKDLVC